MEVNVIKIPEDQDFKRVREICDETKGWTQVYHKKTTRVWTKPPTATAETLANGSNMKGSQANGAVSSFQMIKV